MLVIFIIPIVLIIFTQSIKLIIEQKNKKVTSRNIFIYGGMPSSHTAGVTSLCTIVGFIDGLGSTTFAISFLFSILIVRDALGLRNRLGIGHTISQVIVGFIIGLLGTTLLYYLFF